MIWTSSLANNKLYLCYKITNRARSYFSTLLYLNYTDMLTAKLSLTSCMCNFIKLQVSHIIHVLKVINIAKYVSKFDYTRFLTM